MLLSRLLSIALAVTVGNAGPIQAPSNTGKPSSRGSLLGFDPSLIGKFPKDAIKTEIRTIKPSRTKTKFVVEAPVLPPFAPQGKTGGSHEKRFIVGADNRIPNSDTAYPYSAIGKIQWSNGIYCSGALVGPRHVLTARHCLPSVSGVTGTFSPGFLNGAIFGSSQISIAVTLGPQTGACDTKADWAVLLLSDRLGEQRGWFGVKYPDSMMFDKPIGKHQGYPSDKGGNAPYLQVNTTAASATSLNCDATGPFYSDTDCETGQSGGPFWQQQSDGPYIWGTLSITLSSSQSTYAGWASGSDMIGAIGNLRRDYP